MKKEEDEKQLILENEFKEKIINLNNELYKAEDYNKNLENKLNIIVKTNEKNSIKLREE